MRSLLVVIILFAAAGANAATVTIDFDDLALGGTPDGFGYLEVVTEGYIFSSESGVVEVGAPGNQAMGGLTFADGMNPGEVFISREDGQSFALFDADIDLALGYLAFSDDGNFDDSTGPGLNELGTGQWLNITGVQIYGSLAVFAPVYVDNVMLGTAVPIPAAVWLFGSALAGLGWMRRKKTV
jgi:hypothetical protein